MGPTDVPASKNNNFVASCDCIEAIIELTLWIAGILFPNMFSISSNAKSPPKVSKIFSFSFSSSLSSIFPFISGGIFSSSTRALNSSNSFLANSNVSFISSILS